MSEANPNGPGVKVHYIWTPDFHPSTRFTSLAVIAASVIAVLIFMSLAPLFAPFVNHPDDQALYAGTISLVGFSAVVIGLIYLRNRRLQFMLAYRESRLERILTRTDATSRFPHRAVERVFRVPEIERQSTTLLKMARSLPPNHLVVMNAPRQTVYSGKTLLALYFEPIDLDDERRIEQLTPHGMESLAVTSIYRDNSDSTKGGLTESKPKQPNRRSLISLLIYCTIFLCIGLLGLRQGEIRLGMTSLTFVIIMVSLIWLLPLWLERRCWLMPGGIIVRRFRLWPKLDHFFVLLPSTHCLILDARAAIVRTFHDRKMLTLRFPTSCLTAIVAGWISTARTPTMDEIRTFLGQPDSTSAK